MEPVPKGQEPPSWDELYNIDLMPSELFLKFRKEIEGFRIGVNLEVIFLRFTLELLFYVLRIIGVSLVLVQFYNAPTNDFQTKLVLKPLSPDRRWKFVCKPIQSEVGVLSKKIPLAKFLNLQVGMDHNFKLNAIGWKWKLTTCFGGDGISRIRNKTTLGLFPGMDLRFCWRADYVLPEITGGVGTDEPLFNMYSGRLQASLDRVEAILTHPS